MPDFRRQLRRVAEHLFGFGEVHVQMARHKLAGAGLVERSLEVFPLPVSFTMLKIN
jgi:hypothetical protein